MLHKINMVLRLYWCRICANSLHILVFPAISSETYYSTNLNFLASLTYGMLLFIAQSHVYDERMHFCFRKISLLGIALATFPTHFPPLLATIAGELTPHAIIIFKLTVAQCKCGGSDYKLKKEVWKWMSVLCPWDAEQCYLETLCSGWVGFVCHLFSLCNIIY